MARSPTHRARRSNRHDHHCALPEELPKASKLGAYSNIAQRSYGIVCPGLLGQRKETKVGFDPAKAKQLLRDAGVSGLELTLNTLNDQTRMLAAQIVQSNLGDVGVDVKVVPLESGPWWSLGQESKGDAWKDAELWMMRYGSGADPYEPFQWFRREQVGIWNWERWSDDEFEALYEQGVSEVDPAKRETIYLRMQEIMEETGAYVWLTHEPEIFVHRDTVDPWIDIFGNEWFARFKSA